ncbi:MAG: polysaccharide biosynthesis protein [Bacilli bacterium]|nr:polysaccharide biosynthesis protein [Bacilli bacterium]
MKKDKSMRKNNFITGAFIATLGIVITKILGILYVIPFHSIIGDKGGALYGYAYTIYLFFMSISTAGIPLAISNIVSEYQTLGYYNAKRRAFIIGKRVALLLGFISFLILMLCAPILAKFILGDLTGGNTIEDVTLVIRVISTAILVVPVLSIYRGYFEGHRFMIAPSISQVIEQLFRITIILLGSYLSLKVFKQSLSTAVGIAVFGATAGAIISYLYLLHKRIRNRKKFNERIRPVNEPIITNKQILRKIVFYAVPFIMIDLFKSLYSCIDMVTVVKGLVKYAKFKTSNAEVIMSMLSTWAAKFNMIIASISAGVIVSLIPNLTKSYVDKDSKDMNKKINQSISIVLFLALPIALGISFLSKSIWMLFYGKSIYGPSVLSYSIFIGLFMSLFTVVISVMQVFKNYKAILISLLSGVIVKILLNNYLIKLFHQLGLPEYHGIITATILGYLLSFIICLVVLRKKYKVNYDELVKNFFDILCGSILMVIVLYLFKFVMPIYSDIRIMNLLIIIIYGIIGVLIYFIYTYKTKTIINIFGKSFLKKFKIKKEK